MTTNNLPDVCSTQDRGLLYGDGVFTTLAIQAGKPLCWAQHWQRLCDGCQALNIPPPAQSVVEETLLTLCATLQQPAVIKIIITRGVGGRGYRPPTPPQPSLFFSQHPWPEYSADFWRQGVSLYLCQTRLALQPRLAGIKHLNRLENVLARSEWDAAEIGEGLMLDTQGHLLEGTQSNLFFVTGGVLSTPDLRQCGVAGVMRGLILQAAQQLKIPCRVSQFSLGALYVAEEVFLSNSLIGIWSVRRLLVKGQIHQQWTQTKLATRLRNQLAADGYLATSEESDDATG